MKKASIFLFSFLFCSFAVAGPSLMYISVRPSSSQSYTAEIHLNILMVNTSDVLFYGMELDYGDGTRENLSFVDSLNVLFNPEFRLRKIIRKHTYPGPGGYQIIAAYLNRRGNVVNMDNSINTAMLVETMIYIDPYLGVNETPVLENMPYFHKKGTKYFYELSMTDNEHDSLSFSLRIPKQADDEEVIDYWYPAIRDMGNGRFLNRILIDPAQGALLWNTGDEKGYYTVALNVDEWRKTEQGYQLISSTVIDYVISIQETENAAPFISVLRDTVILAGQPFSLDLAADDPDMDSVSVGLYGEFTDLMGVSVREGGKYYAPPFSLNKSYSPMERHIRHRPYKLAVTVIDKQDTARSLGAMASMHVWIADRGHYPSPPANLSAVSSDPSAVVLAWHDSDDELGYIVEREDDRFPGYEKIAILPPDIAVFYDSGTVAASSYRYRVRAVGSQMAVSGVASVTTPVITSLKKSSDFHEIKIFPNPSGGSFKLINAPENGTVRILNLSGRVVWENDDYFNTTSGEGLPIQTQLSPGVYLLNVSAGEQEITRKLVIR